MEGLRIGGLMEIEVTTKDFIGSLTTEYHLDTHRLDDASQQVHRRRSPNGSNIVGLDEVDNIADGIESFLNGIVDFMVDSTDMVGHHLGLGQIRRTFQAHGEGVQTGPIGTRLRVVLDTMLAELLGNGRNN